MKIDHKLWVYMASIGWCIKCGKITDMQPIKTGLPGISSKQCNECKSGVRINYLEEDDVEIDDDLIVIPDNFCPTCKTITHHSDITVTNDHGMFTAKRCDQCLGYIIDFGNEFAFFELGYNRHKELE